MTDKDRQPGLPNLPVALKPRDRLELEMVVLDEDPQDAREFLDEHGVEIGEGDDPLAVCTKWLRRIEAAERGRLKIRYTDKGPTLDLT